MYHDAAAAAAAAAAVREAELTIINAKWHICQDQAIERLSRWAGLGCSPLFPRYPVIQIVVCDGELIGRARLHRSGGRIRWVATTAAQAHQIGEFRTLQGAARALATEAGLGRRLRVHYLPS